MLEFKVTLLMTKNKYPFDDNNKASPRPWKPNAVSRYYYFNPGAKPQKVVYYWSSFRPFGRHFRPNFVDNISL